MFITASTIRSQCKSGFDSGSELEVISYVHLRPLNQPAPKKLSETEAKFYKQALAELESGKRDSGIWAKAYADASDEESSKRLYVSLRADALRLAQEPVGYLEFLLYVFLGVVVIAVLVTIFGA
jgi:hypothetical protein